MQQSIVKFYCFVVDTAQHVSGTIMPINRSPSNCRCSLWFPYECGGGRVLSSGRLRTRPSQHSYGNQRLQRQFDGLLMMDIIMPETCWAVSVRQSNKILRLIVASSWVFYLRDSIFIFASRFVTYGAFLNNVLHSRNVLYSRFPTKILHPLRISHTCQVQLSTAMRDLSFS